MSATQKITLNATAKKTTIVSSGLMLSRIDPPPDDVVGTPADTAVVAVALGVTVGATATRWANCEMAGCSSILTEFHLSLPHFEYLLAAATCRELAVTAHPHA
jgi:hypothetical protein